MSAQHERIGVSPTITVDAERSVSVATTQLVRFHMHAPADNYRREEENYWLDMCLTPRPRNARACFVERWASHRFERIGQVFLLPPRRLEAGLDIGDKNLRWLLMRLAEELRAPGFGGAVLLELIVAQISIELARYCVAVKERPSASALAPWRLRLIDERLRDAPGSPSLAELAGLCNMSVRQLTRAFRASRGCSIGDYVAAARIDHAKRLLVSEQSIKAVAYALGFGSPSSFAFAFRKATGLTPRAYQLSARGSSRV
jgi:AraC family transcriptional regulator